MTKPRATHQVLVRLTPQQYHELGLLADLQGNSRATVIRQMVQAGLDGRAALNALRTVVAEATAAARDALDQPDLPEVHAGD